MSIFRTLDEINSRVIDVVNDQPCRIIPMRDMPTASAHNPNARRVADSDRQPMDVRCVFEYNSNEFGMELGVRKSYREANDLRNVSVGRTPEATIDRRYFTNRNDEPRQGDKFLLLNEDGTVNMNYPPFEVMDNQRDGLARFRMRLIQKETQT